MRTTITGKNQVTLPAKLVRELDWKPGTLLDWSTTEDGSLVARRSPLRGERALELQELMKKYVKPGESVVEGLLRERAEDDVLDQEDEPRSL